MNFTHLHVHSHYSLLDGLAKIDQLLDYCQELGMDSLALTDHGTMYGAIEFYKKAKARNIKPIIGSEIYLALDKLTDKRPRIDDKRYHLVLLAKNKTGYQNLIKLTTIAWLDGFYYKPRIDKETLKKYSQGLIGLSACLSGEIPKAILSGNIKQAEKLALEYQEIFGQGNFFLEIEHHSGIPEQEKVNQTIIQLSRQLKIPLVATHDVHYLKPEDAEAQDVLMAVNTSAKIENENRLSMRQDDFSLQPPEQMFEWFDEAPEAIKNTQRIARVCNLEIELNKIQLPHFPLPKGKTADDCLKEFCYQGLTKRYKKTTKEILDRLNYELKVIKQTGFASYFLIVQDFVNWAKNHDIICGPGRGSAAGSLVSYLLNITDIDPLKYHLIFERFLNPDRVSMPDFDLDFADTRRDEVIDYVAQKYGREHVAQIITFGTMAARAVIRDAGRAMDYPYNLCDQVAKTIPFGLSLEKALHESIELHQMYDSDEQIKKLIDTALKLEGVARHASTHAAGIVVTKEPLNESVPLQRPTQDDKAIITQYEMHSIEDLGLLKMDFLGLKTLTQIENTLKIVQKTKDINIDISSLPPEDPLTYKLLQEARTTGVFQLESGGMKRYLRQLKPTVFEDIIAMVSLYRPGPIEFIPEFIARKHGLKKIKYLHPKLEKVLKNTHGIAVYQEQVMEIAKELAGFTMSEADILRKAVGKKIKKLLDKQQDKLIKGMKRNNIKRQTAEQIWKSIEPFARYGFNRCVTADTEIINHKTGDILSIGKIYKQKKLFTTLSCNETLKLQKAPVIKIFKNGIKPVYEITTRLGKQIKVTANHPFLTIKGWRNLEDLKTHDKIALARSLPINSKGAPKIKTHHLIVLGYLLAEGNLCHPNSFYFYSTDEKEIQDYKKALEKFKNTKGTINRSKKATSIYAGRVNLKEEPEAVKWIKTTGLWYKKATQKEFPNFVFRLNEKQLSLLLGKMFQGDGCINLKRKYPQIFYATSSLKMAQQLQHLLLRLNIIASLHHKKFKYRGGIKNGYTLNINRYQNIKNLYHHLGSHLIGKQRKCLEKIIKTHPIISGKIKENSARGSKDTVPIEIQPIVRNEIKKYGFKSFKECSQKMGISERLLWSNKKKKGYLRETLNIIGKALNSQVILDYANSDIYWDEIVKIEAFGKEETYDLTVESFHNFLANDFIVHNSHAACYAMIGYQTAYLKSHFPTEFMTALLNSEQNDIERVAFLVDECRKMNIEVLAPDINESLENFTFIKEGVIRFGLATIKNVGQNIVATIVQERKNNNAFLSISDFVERLAHLAQDLNKRSLESLIKCGAFDKLGERGQLLDNLENILSYLREIQKPRQNGQVSLFEATNEQGQRIAKTIPQLKLREATPATKKEKLSWEKELLGLYVSEHPINDYQKRIKGKAVLCSKLSSGLINQRVKAAGVISKIQKIITRTGRPMLFVQIEDDKAKIEVLVFPNTLEQSATLWQEEKVIVVGGKLDNKDGNLKILCDEVMEVT